MVVEDVALHGGGEPALRGEAELMVIPTRVGKHRQVCRIAGPSGGPNRWQIRYRESQGADLTGPARDSFPTGAAPQQRS